MDKWEWWLWLAHGSGIGWLGIVIGGVDEGLVAKGCVGTGGRAKDTGGDSVEQKVVVSDRVVEGRVRGG